MTHTLGPPARRSSPDAYEATALYTLHSTLLSDEDGAELTPERHRGRSVH
jgi:hypothetical protein